MRRSPLLFVLLAFTAASGADDPLRRGAAAYEAGDHATARVAWRPLAQAGNPRTAGRPTRSAMHFEENVTGPGASGRGRANPRPVSLAGTPE
jgi:hypothetical protein